MSPIAKMMLRPRVNLTGAGISAVAEIASWFTAFDDPYRVTPVAFVLCVLFIGLFAVNEHLVAEQLRGAAQSTLRLVFDKNGQLYDSLHYSDTVRILRVGVMNSGASVANVAVKLARVHPRLDHVFPMQEFQQTHAAEGVSRFTVNESNEPLVFVDVVHQRLYREDGTSGGSVGGESYSRRYRKGQTADLRFSFAGGQRDVHAATDHPADPYRDQYLLWLAIDGAGSEGTRKFVLRRNDRGQYDMAEAFS